MREKSVPVVTQAAETSLGQIPARNARLHPDLVAFSRRPAGSPVWEDVTCAAFEREVTALAAGMRAAGLNRGDRVAIMARTRYEWTLTDFAIWAAGLVSVPVYETSAADQVQWILADSGCRAVVVETAAHHAVVESVRQDCPHVQHLWQIEAGDLERLAIPHADPALLADVAQVCAQDTATIIYTSGTTGRPKGCVLSHQNFLELSANTIAAIPEITLRPGASILLFLPLAHVLARLIEVVAVDGRLRVGHAPDIKALLPDLASFEPTFLLAVPRVFEKIYNSLDQRAAAEGKGRIFRMAARTAISYSRALDAPSVPLRLQLQHKVFDALVYSKLRAALGGRCEYAISGGAPLGERLGHFFRGAGIVVLEGYGLTETTAPTNVNLPSFNTIGTVGQPLPGTATRIADDGELLVKGIGVFGRYLNNPQATAEAFTQDGWFHTGDLASIDEAGRLRITGRKKEILVTAGGKNVAPAPLEDAIRAHPLVSQCLVVGDQRPYVAALLTLDAEMLPAWGKAHGLPDLTIEAARTDEVVREHLQSAIDRANAKVSRAEGIRRFTIVEGDFTEESGHLTPSMKLKRAAVTRDFAGQIEELYGAALPVGGA